MSFIHMFTGLYTVWGRRLVGRIGHSRVCLRIVLTVTKLDRFVVSHGS